MSAPHVSARGRALIKQFEGFRADAYQDVVGVWTIGYGFTRGVQPGQHMTPQQAEARLITELLGYEQAVLNGCTLEPNQNQLDAMCSLAWNIGIAGFLRSTVLKCHNRGDAQSASRAFGLWNKAGGREWAGLTRRRAAEAALYLEPAPGMVQRIVEGSIPSAQAGEVPPPAQAMPQQIDPESSMAGSAINRAATVAGTTAATVGAVSQIKTSVSELQGWIVPMLCIAVVALAGYIVCARIVAGPWWQPTWGAEYGCTTLVVDNSTNARTDAGDLLSDRAPMHQELTLNLPLLSEAERSQLMQILRANGVWKPVFVSLMPRAGTAAEQDHMIYGKRKNSPMSLPYFDRFSHALELESW